MNFYVSSILLILSVYIPTLVLCNGRNPQAIEQIQCKAVYYDKLNPDDGRARLEAYNIGRSGSLCKTTCRMIVGKNITPFDPIPSPDFITCAPGPRYCYRGKCSTPETISKESKTNSCSNSSTTTSTTQVTTAATTTSPESGS